MKPAIQVEGISKQFRLGARRGGDDYRTLREAIVAGVRAPWDRLRAAAGKSATNDRDESLFWALNDVSFEIQPGEVVGIIGRNGSGKSTLLKILSQIYEPTAGRAVIRGRLASLLEVGTGFHPELTGRENIYLNGSILGMARTEIDRKFDEIVAFSEVEQFLDTPVKRYSSGMYVRLAFAVAAHLEPEILIVDEVLAVGDAAFQKKCLGKMGQVATGGRAVLFVSHSMPAVLQLCTRSVWLDRGVCRMIGDTRRVVSNYFGEWDDSKVAEINLGSLERRGRLRQAIRFGLCSLACNQPGRPWAIEFGTPIHLRLTIDVTTWVSGVEIGLAVCTGDGLELASPISSDGIGRRDLTPGRYAVDVALPSLVLAPGRYYLGLGLRSDFGMEDHIEHAARFEVVETTASSERLVHHRRGFVIPDVSCEFNRVD